MDDLFYNLDGLSDKSEQMLNIDELIEDVFDSLYYTGLILPSTSELSISKIAFLRSYCFYSRHVTYGMSPNTHTDSEVFKKHIKNLYETEKKLNKLYSLMIDRGIMKITK